LIIERTFSIDVINAVLKHPSVKKCIGDDFSGDVEYPIVDNIYYLAVYDEGLAGMFVVYPLNAITYDAHSAILPQCYGEKAKVAGKLAISWVFENTDALKINGSTPVYNKLALKYSKEIGFEQEGLNKNSIMKDGKLHDQVYFGLERKKWELN
jgi:hypothetical protein